MLCDCATRVHPGIDCSSDKCHCHIRPRTHNVFENNEVVDHPDIETYEPEEELVEEPVDPIDKKLEEETGFTTTAAAVRKNRKKEK